MTEAQIQLQNALTTTFLANMAFLSEYDNELYHKVDELSCMIASGSYKEKYELEGEESTTLVEKNLKIAKLTGPLPKFIKNRALGRLKKMLKLESFVIIDNVPDMVAATKTLTGYLSQCKIDFINELEKI